MRLAMMMMMMMMIVDVVVVVGVPLGCSKGPDLWTGYGYGYADYAMWLCAYWVLVGDVSCCTCCKLGE